MSIGKTKANGSLQKFYLGWDLAIAARRRQWIESIYVENCRMFQSKFWDEAYLNLARQVERLGSAVYQIPVDVSPFSGPADYGFIQRLRDVGVPISIIGEAHARVALVPDVTPTGKPAITKLHQAIDRYKEDRGEEKAKKSCHVGIVILT